jgi:hypothetical protein
MHAYQARGRWPGSALLGLLLVAVGVGAVALRTIDVNPFDAIADAGWPLFVIIPGLALLAVGLLAYPPRGLGFVIAGTIVSAVGLLLWYQDTTGHWTSWTYAWALIGPGAAGLALIAYGTIFRMRNEVLAGLRLVGVSAILFTAGYWFFETLFSTGRVPFAVGDWWPALIIVAGATLLLVGALQQRPQPIRPLGHEREDER